MNAADLEPYSSTPPPCDTYVLSASPNSVAALNWLLTVRATQCKMNAGERNKQHLEGS